MSWQDKCNEIRAAYDGPYGEVVARGAKVRLTERSLAEEAARGRALLRGVLKGAVPTSPVEGLSSDELERAESMALVVCDRIADQMTRVTSARLATLSMEDREWLECAALALGKGAVQLTRALARLDAKGRIARLEWEPEGSDLLTIVGEIDSSLWWAL